MTQLVTRIDEKLADQIDALISDGTVDSRSDAVRRGLTALVEQARQKRIGDQIADGYRSQPQTETEGAWPDAATTAMIAEEAW